MWSLILVYGLVTGEPVAFILRYSGLSVSQQPRLAGLVVLQHLDHYCPRGVIGSRSGLKSRFPQGSGSSSLPEGNVWIRSLKGIEEFHES